MRLIACLVAAVTLAACTSPPAQQPASASAPVPAAYPALLPLSELIDPDMMAPGAAANQAAAQTDGLTARSAALKARAERLAR